VNSYPHSKHPYQKPGAKYQHGPEAIAASKKLYDSENDDPYYYYGNDVSAKHRVVFVT